MSKYTVEDCLEILIGHRNIPGASWREHKFKLFPENRKVLTSIGTQVFRGKALTEKQHELVKTLLVEWYTEQFAENGITILDHVNLTREPYRVVDKSHWIKRTTTNDQDYISIRFPFSNEVIDHINDLKKNTDKEEYFYNQHQHNFLFNEKNVFKLIDIALRFKTEFDIDEEILSYYHQIVDIKNHEEDYIPGVYNFEYKNLHPSLEEHLLDTYGKPTPENIIGLWDKRRLYGLHHFDNIAVANYSSLRQKIFARRTSNIHVRTKVWTSTQLFTAIYEMDRFPLLILLNEERAADELSLVYNDVKGFVDNKDVSVMFRLDNKNGNEFNQFIRDKGLNNSISNETKIVIANRKKITKPILKSNWTPVCMLTFGPSRFPGYVVDGYLTQFDLKLYYTEEDSIISQYSKKRDYHEGIEAV